MGQKGMKMKQVKGTTRERKIRLEQYHPVYITKENKPKLNSDICKGWSNKFVHGQLDDAKSSINWGLASLQGRL